MSISRNPVEYLRRHGLVNEPARPRPRLDIEALLVHSIPISDPPMPQTKVLEPFEGDPPPDRGTARPWPGQTEQT
jgi:hypothetical protein